MIKFVLTNNFNCEKYMFYFIASLSFCTKCVPETKAGLDPRVSNSTPEQILTKQQKRVTSFFLHCLDGQSYDDLDSPLRSSLEKSALQRKKNVIVD